MLISVITMNTGYPQDKWLHVFTGGSQIEGYITAGAGIHWEPFSCYMPLGQQWTAFGGDNNSGLPLVEITTMDCLWWR
jgi:hypothetical protein